MADPCRLYLITPPSIDSAFADTLARALDAGDVACLQLRLKDADRDTVRAAIDALRPIAQSRNVAFLLNDDPHLAADSGCDGVHIGQDDSPYSDARAAFGTNGIVGVSCQASRHLAIDAADSGADYVAFGAFYCSATKQSEDTVELEVLQLWHEVTTVPCVAVGGITVKNCAPLVRAGANFIAVVAGVWDYPDGAAAAVHDFNAAIASAEAS